MQREVQSDSEHQEDDTDFRELERQSSDQRRIRG